MNNDPLVFQIIDITTTHEDVEIEDSDDDNSSENKKSYNLLEYKIQLFGKTKLGENVYVKVNNFKPYFYVKVPGKWSRTNIKTYVNKIVRSINYVPNRLSLVEKNGKNYKIVKKQIFNTFKNYKTYKFIKFSFHGFKGFKAYEYAIIEENNIRKKRGLKEIELYESNLEPMLRFLHQRDIKAAGWVSVKNYVNCKDSDNEYSVEVDWTDVDPVNDDNIAKFTICSFDLECEAEDGENFPVATNPGDRIIQIGTTLNKYGDINCFYKHIMTLDSCSPIEGVIVESFDSERKLLLAWAKLIKKLNPDIMTGYNIFAFDYPYLYERAKLLGIQSEFSFLSRLIDHQCEYSKKELSSAAYGDNIFYFYDMKGRVQVDLMKVLQRDPCIRLESYKLDNVASEFIKEGIIKVEQLDNGTTKIYTKSHFGLTTGRFIKINYQDGFTLNAYNDGEKFYVTELGIETIDNIKYCTITINKTFDTPLMKEYKFFWAQAKDDITAQEMFKLQKGNADDRAIIAKYCVNDCDLVNKLMEKLQIITNNISMANVCHVPLSYIFMRGQGIKIFSLVAKKCRLRNHLMKVLKKKPKPDYSKMTPKEKKAAILAEQIANGYEGATVIQPNAGIYYEPIPVLDYASLYPRSMIGKSISHDRLVEKEKYMNLPGYKYYTATYENKNGTQDVCVYACSLDKQVIGIITEILIELLEARESTRARQKTVNDPFMWKILEGLQLAFKVTANSLYGQTGATTSSIYNKKIAASTTATGREMLMSAKKFAEEVMPLLAEAVINNDKPLFERRVMQLLNENSCDNIVMFPGVEANEEMLEEKGKYSDKATFVEWYYNQLGEVLKDRAIDPKSIYGDTDSIFVNYGIMDRTSRERLTDHDTLKRAIKIGILTGDLYNIIVPRPHNLEYEKTFWPFIIHTKKRYVGNMYMFNPDVYYLKSMGIVLVRRDNAPIVKIVVGGIVKKIIDERSSEKAVEYARQELKKILNNHYDISKFVVSKTLKAKYADRTRNVHVVLADRIALRDPGNKPQTNDRIPYVYVTDYNRKYKNRFREKQLQGEKVESPSYIIENNLHIDYLFYITNQIQKPASQFLDYIIKDTEKFFRDYIIREENRRKGIKPIKTYFNTTDNTGSFDINDDNIKQELPKKKVINRKKITKPIDVTNKLNIDDLDPIITSKKNKSNISLVKTRNIKPIRIQKVKKSEPVSRKTKQLNKFVSHDNNDGFTLD